MHQHPHYDRSDDPNLNAIASRTLTLTLLSLHGPQAVVVCFLRGPFGPDGFEGDILLTARGARAQAVIYSALKSLL